MGTYCSTERKKDKEVKSSSPKGSKRATKYTVANEENDNDTTSNAAAAAPRTDEGFSVVGSSTEEANGRPASRAETAKTSSSPSLSSAGVTTTKAPTANVSYHPNPALAKEMSYKIVPQCDRAVIKQNSRDPADYEAEGLEGVTWTRVPGQINDQRINIANCKNSTFVLLDQCDSVQIDDCEGCRFYIGPTAGSVFIRSSSNCKVIAACGQLRTRDLHDSTLALFCHSRPVIESSKNVGVACYPSTHAYQQLLHHMCKSRLSQFTNLWFFIHDFTPSKKAGELNYHIVPQSVVESSDFFPSIDSLMPPEDNVLTAAEASLLFETSAVIPYTAWNTVSPLPFASLVIFCPGAVPAARAFAATVELKRRASMNKSAAAEASLEKCEAYWHMLVEHQFKGPVDGSTQSMLQQLGVPASDVNKLNGHSFIMGVYSHKEESGLARELPLDVKANVLYHGSIDPVHIGGVCLRVFSDLPTQGKGFGASH